ncbi:MAG: SWIM zinc finger family protein [Actinomycetota bacterium]|nr:SWIM zinc finger family protein [Actinomycetota bacterium]
MLALAPDSNSVAAARGLTNPRTWSELGCTDSLVFGRCQGSGKQPYQVTVDLAEPAFGCTCPSRKLPCKHGLALLLLWVEHGDAVGQVRAVADFAGDWAAERAAKASAIAFRHAAGRAARAAAGRAEIADPEAQAKRRAEREAAMTAGLDEFERWLSDLVRQGLAGARRQPYSFWDSMAARLVDAQLPSLADRVRDVGGSVAARDDWADALLAECGRWELAIHAWRRRDSLAPDTLGDLRAFLGWPRRPDEVARFERARDRWVAAGVRQGDDGRITSQRTWLFGQQTKRWAVVLDFAAAGAALQVAHVVGTVVEDGLIVHPGSDPGRVALSGDQQVVGRDAVPTAVRVAEAVDQLAMWLAANPWRDRLPVALAGVTLADEGRGRWWLQDGAGDRLPLAPTIDPWLLLALSGGTPVTLTGEWDGGLIFPMAVTTAGQLVPL